MLLLIDNYDSFSYNLYQLVGSVEPDIRVIRNDAMTVEEIEALHPAGIILSPGPGHPEEAGVCIEVVQKLGSKIPILGVCLGHQSICTAYGATVSYAKQLMHGKQSDAGLDGSSPLFKGCKATEPVARYPSLAAIEDTLPDCLRKRCPPVSPSLPGQTTGRSWRCSTENIPSTASSSIRNPL